MSSLFFENILAIIVPFDTVNESDIIEAKEQPLIHSKSLHYIISLID